MFFSATHSDFKQTALILWITSKSADFSCCALLESKRPCIFLWIVIISLLQSIEYLRSVAGFRTVPVEVGSRYTDENWSQTLLTVNEFIDQYISKKVSASFYFKSQMIISVKANKNHHAVFCFPGSSVWDWTQSCGLPCTTPAFWSGMKKDAWFSKA